MRGRRKLGLATDSAILHLFKQSWLMSVCKLKKSLTLKLAAVYQREGQKVIALPQK